MLLIDEVVAGRLAHIFTRLLESYKPDAFTDPRFYPPPDADPELAARYFLVMVAMDHRLSRPGRPYEGLVDGERYHGADLLYALGARRLREEPGFFDPASLSRVTPEDVRRWLRSDDGVEPPDPELRAALLRDLGAKLFECFGGSVTRMLEESRGVLRGHPRGERGLLDNLRCFLAYNDPVEKKSHLLAKFLERRGLFRARDSWHKHVPVDNHVTRLALRTGLVRPTGSMAHLFEPGGPEVDPETDVYIRMVVRRAWDLVASYTGIDPYILDDLLWAGGRACCRQDRLACIHGCSEKCEKLGLCRRGACVLKDVCRAGRERIVEHKFYNTWWY